MGPLGPSTIASNIDNELHHGDFLELNDLIAPLNEDDMEVVHNLQRENDNSNIALVTAGFATGPLAPIFQGLPDLNIDVGPIGMVDEPPLADGPPHAQQEHDSIGRGHQLLLWISLKT